MVKIRYSELPAGLHVVAKACRRGTVVYLLPGLTQAQRRAALVRVRRSARMGHGPPMPTLSMALAVAADRARTTTRNGAAALRRHPMVLLPPLIAVLASAIVFTLMSFVTLTIAPPDNAAAAAVPTLGIGAGQTADRGADTASAPASQHKPSQHKLSQHKPVLSASPRRLRRHRAAASPPPPKSQSPPPGGRCIKLGPFRFCMRS